jgi:methylated-DNA-[protein]-cysteine S-methyltransferase
MRTRHTVIDSPMGPLTIAADGDHLTGLYFQHHRPRPAADALGDYVLPDADVLLAQTATQIDEYLRGCRRRFDLPTALVGDIRHRRVWELLSDIDYGRTTTYGELAAELADGTTPYEVGQIVGRNPISIVLPCHRVIGKNGKLTGYAGGLARKRFLLELEEPAPALAGRLF